MASKACSIEGCANTGKMRRGWCNMHYSRWRTHGDPDYTRPVRGCAVEECGRPHDSHGYCASHAWRFKKHGDPRTDIPLRTLGDPEATFGRKATPQGDCLVWTGALSAAGYGQIGVAGRVEYAHRYAWERAHGEIPGGIEIDHACHNRACVRVEHLRAATRQENARNLRGSNVGRDLPRGVSRYRGKYRARVSIQGSESTLGYFATPEEARKVAAAARQEAYGEFAGLDTPRPRKEPHAHL